MDRTCESLQIPCGIFHFLWVCLCFLFIQVYTCIPFAHVATLTLSVSVMFVSLCALLSSHDCLVLFLQQKSLLGSGWGDGICGALVQFGCY